MKTLLILRHAKSSWKDAALPDHDRPLNKRGKRSTKLIGRLLSDEGLTPEVILSSTAVRAQQTVKAVAAAAGLEADVDLIPQLYLAPPDAYLDLVAVQSDAIECIMVVGHNPGLEQLVTATTGAFERFPTAALAQVEFDIDHWHEVIESQGILVNLWRPRELE